MKTTKAGFSRMAMVLTLIGITVPAFGEGEIRDGKRARFVCQSEDPTSRVFILDQISVATDPKLNFGGFETLDGRVLIDKNHEREITGDVKMRLRIYNLDVIYGEDSIPDLTQDNKTTRDIIDDLAKKEAPGAIPSPDKRQVEEVRFDHIGLGNRRYDQIYFATTENGHLYTYSILYGFLRPPIAILSTEKFISSNYDASGRIISHNVTDFDWRANGTYKCIDPILLPLL